MSLFFNFMKEIKLVAADYGLDSGLIKISMALQKRISLRQNLMAEVLNCLKSY